MIIFEAKLDNDGGTREVNTIRYILNSQTVVVYKKLFFSDEYQESYSA